MYQARKFSQESYNNNDKPARDLFIPWAKRNGYDILKDEEDFQVDLTIQHRSTKKIWRVELEKRNLKLVEGGIQYHTGKFFNTLSFTGRKQKWNNTQDPFIYVIIDNQNKAAVAQSTAIYKDEYRQEITVNTQHRQGDDLMYRIPPDKYKVIDLNK